MEWNHRAVISLIIETGGRGEEFNYEVRIERQDEARATARSPIRGWMSLENTAGHTRFCEWATFYKLFSFRMDTASKVCFSQPADN